MSFYRFYKSYSPPAIRTSTAISAATTTPSDEELHMSNKKIKTRTHIPHTAESPSVFFASPHNISAFSKKIVMDHGLKPINPLQCGRQACPPLHSYGPVVRDFWLLHFVISGKGVLINQNGSYTVRENQIFVIRPYEQVSYKADASDPWHYVWIGFTAEGTELPSVLKENDVITAPYLKDLFLSAYEADDFVVNTNSGAYEHYLCGAIWQLLGKLLYNTQKSANALEKYILPSINYMKTVYYHPGITIEVIAEKLHVNKSYFSEIFKKATGMSPKQYLNDIRMKKAAERLTKENFTVSAVATSVGFPDAFSFSRAFKKHYDCSPSEYIKRAKAR